MGQCSAVVCQLYEYHYINVKKTWTEAQQYCREKHTDLATVSNMTDMERLLSNSAGDMRGAWIGLYDQTGGNRTWRWSLPGVEFNKSYQPWNTDEPNDANGLQNCGIIWKTLKWGDIECRWRNENCAVSKPFICYDDKLILIKETKTWEEALYYCRHHHHDLVTITNLDEQRWVQKKAKKASTDYVWLGLRYTCTLNFWFWVSDEVVSYENWAPDGLMDDCDMSGAMKTGGQHQWFKRNDSEEFSFICSKH
ncbi:C-type mannose receptor 2-like [Fundulus heteroclitus]|uniref:C-type mannose receptor 2-like n=1 Tax=Fundulus heteroclitus TaxID=8078 RepID=UPI00165C40B5|nr:C-type mannose receptor 2-like [Fundulus heteroclitus]